MSVRRQTSANDMNNMFNPGSGIPLPATAAKRRADIPPPTSAQPPLNKMRMSIAGGAGPSRPPQQVYQSLAPPEPHFAPRASTYGTGQGNPLLMSSRKDQSLYGRTPSRGGPQTSGRRPGVMGSNWTVSKEIRPIRDRAYQAMMQREILDYLTQARCSIPNLSIRTLQTPTNREFHLLFQFLITDIDGTYVFRKEKKPEEEIILILRDLKYPLVDSISKTSLAAPGSSSAWPTLLAMLHWLVTISQQLPKWFDLDLCHDYNLAPLDQIPLDVDIPNFAKLLTCDYVFNAYAQYMDGHDVFRDQDMELENNVDRKNEAAIQRCDETEIRIAKLRTEIDKMRTNPSELTALEGEVEKLQVDLEKLNAHLKEKQEKVDKNIAARGLIIQTIGEIETEINHLNIEHEGIMARIAEQGLTAEQVQQMNAERDNLKRTHEDLLPKAEEAALTMGELEIALGKRADAVDQVVGRYQTLIYNTGLAPQAPPPFEHINFQLELNTAVSNPMEMLKGDMRNVIHPALRDIVEAKSRERADVEDERIRADDELEVLTAQCETMMEEAEPKENRLKVLQSKTEELRNTVAAETAVANAEAGKLERDLGQIESAVQQSEIALRSRKQRLQVEYADVVRKTEHLKEDTNKKITFECNQMLEFKKDVTRKLEDLVLFARDN